MRNIWTIAKREYDLYFISPVAYVVAFLFFVIIGLIFVLNLVALSLNSFGFAPAPTPQSVTAAMAFLIMLAVPPLTMRLVADEVRMGTMELMLTAPVRDFELVVGKWLGSFLFMLTLIAASLVFPLMMQQVADPGIDQMLMMAGYLGVILLTAALLALGVGISSIFSNQIAAFFGTLSLFIVMWWLIGAPASILPGGAEVFRYLDIQSHFYESFNQGIISLAGITYYLSLTVLGLVIGTAAIETRRWR
jgi:ABC-2 type transport system permease protein